MVEEVEVDKEVHIKEIVIEEKDTKRTNLVELNTKKKIMIIIKEKEDHFHHNPLQEIIMKKRCHQDIWRIKNIKILVLEITTKILD